MSLNNLIQFNYILHSNVVLHHLCFSSTMMTSNAGLLPASSAVKTTTCATLLSTALLTLCVRQCPSTSSTLYLSSSKPEKVPCTLPSDGLCVCSAGLADPTE